MHRFVSGSEIISNDLKRRELMSSARAQSSMAGNGERERERERERARERERERVSE